MREADRRTIEDLGMPSFTLMESASRSVTSAILERYGPVEGKRVVVACGTGGNGGDGMAVARALANYGARCTTLLVRDDDLRGDTARNLLLLRALGTVEIALAESVDLRAYEGADFYIDALLGTGLTSAPRGTAADLIAWLSERAAPVVSIDVPSGLHADTGQVLGTDRAAVRAEFTVTLAALKPGLLLGEGPEYAGAVEVAEIGVPPQILEAVARETGRVEVTTNALIRRMRPRRAADAHKYSAGLVLAIAGAPGITGAPVMTSEAAARAGAGYVVCACPEAIEPLLAARFTEVATLALPQDGDALDPDAALEALAPKLKKAAALVVGPGLGTHDATQRFVRRLLRETDLPFVLDADGLNAFAGRAEELAEVTQGRAILTPHAGEFARLAGDDVDLSDRLEIARAYAQRWNAVLILKGMPSVIGLPGGRAYVNGTGGPALATAGTGDVLAGMCAGFLAQGASPEAAAVCATHIGGAAADRFSRHSDPASLVASDLLRELPTTLQALSSSP